MDRRWGLVIGMYCYMAAARLSDMWITRMLDPGLHGERNALYVRGADLLVLVGMNLAVVAAAGTLFALAVWRHERLMPAPGMEFREFVIHMYYGKQRPWWQRLYMWPPSGRLVWVVGRAAPWLLIGVSIFVDVGNLLSFSDAGAAAVWARLFGTSAAFMLSLLVVTMALFAVWISWEFRFYARRKKASRRALPLEA